MKGSSNLRIGLIAASVWLLDQLSKYVVMSYLGFREEVIVIDGFFRLVHWGNTGAAWSFFKDHNGILAAVSAGAMIVLFLTRHHFGAEHTLGKVALGLLFGGISGNLTDRLLSSRRHVIDFLYFYVNQRGGGELGFPAFNVADSAICVGVGLLFLLSWQRDQTRTVTSVSQTT